LGIKPTLETSQYAGKDLKSIGQMYGLVYKNEIYKSILTKIKETMNRHTGNYFLSSVTRQRSLLDYIFVIKGQVLQKWVDFTAGNNDA
jgi:hypothetical protein